MFKLVIDVIVAFWLPRTASPGLGGEDSFTAGPGKIKIVSKLCKRAIFNSVNPEVRFQVVQIYPRVN